ncbi:MAG: hypothetical protein AAF539_13685 [Planctomycetota bacterium]
MQCLLRRARRIRTVTDTRTVVVRYRENQPDQTLSDTTAQTDTTAADVITTSTDEVPASGNFRFDHAVDQSHSNGETMREYLDPENPVDRPDGQPLDGDVTFEEIDTYTYVTDFIRRRLAVIFDVSDQHLFGSDQLQSAHLSTDLEPFAPASFSPASGTPTITRNVVASGVESSANSVAFPADAAAFDAANDSMPSMASITVSAAHADVTAWLPTGARAQLLFLIDAPKDAGGDALENTGALLSNLRLDITPVPSLTDSGADVQANWRQTFARIDGQTYVSEQTLPRHDFELDINLLSHDGFFNDRTHSITIDLVTQSDAVPPHADPNDAWDVYQTFELEARQLEFLDSSGTGIGQHAVIRLNTPGRNSVLDSELLSTNEEFTSDNEDISLTLQSPHWIRYRGPANGRPPVLEWTMHGDDDSVSGSASGRQVQLDASFTRIEAPDGPLYLRLSVHGPPNALRTLAIVGLANPSHGTQLSCEERFTCSAADPYTHVAWEVDSVTVGPWVNGEFQSRTLDRDACTAQSGQHGNAILYYACIETFDESTGAVVSRTDGQLINPLPMSCDFSVSRIEPSEVSTLGDLSSAGDAALFVISETGLMAGAVFHRDQGNLIYIGQSYVPSLDQLPAQVDIDAMIAAMAGSTASPYYLQVASDTYSVDETSLATAASANVEPVPTASRVSLTVEASYVDDFPWQGISLVEGNTYYHIVGRGGFLSAGLSAIVFDLDATDPPGLVIATSIDTPADAIAQWTWEEIDYSDLNLPPQWEPRPTVPDTSAQWSVAVTLVKSDLV